MAHLLWPWERHDVEWSRDAVVAATLVVKEQSKFSRMRLHSMLDALTLPETELSKHDMAHHSMKDALILPVTALSRHDMAHHSANIYAGTFH